MGNLVDRSSSAWRDENSVLNKQRVHPGFLAPFSPNLRSMFIFPPLAKGGAGGVVTARFSRLKSSFMASHLSSSCIPLTRREESFSTSKPPAPPPLPPLCKGGKGAVTRAVVGSRATETRVSKSSLQLRQHQLFTGPGPAWSGFSAQRALRPWGQSAS